MKLTEYLVGNGDMVSEGDAIAKVDKVSVMPYIEARRNGSGSVTSYRIVISTGYDDYGKQIRHRFIWTPPKPGMSGKQMEKEATAAAYKYESRSTTVFSLTSIRPFRSMPNMCWT